MFSLGGGSPVLIPLDTVASQPLLQAEGGVIVYSCFYGQFRRRQAHVLEEQLKEVWTSVGGLFLFTNLGLLIELQTFSQGIKYLPVVIAGMFGRLLMIILIAFFAPLNGSRQFFIRSSRNWRKVMPFEILFLWLSSLPRATVQGTNANIALELVLFTQYFNQQIHVSAIFVLAIWSLAGSFLLDFFGIRILRYLSKVPGKAYVALEEEKKEEEKKEEDKK